MSFNQRTKIKALLATEAQEQQVTVMGWVRTFRSNRFIALNDGSTINNIQIVVDFENTDELVLKEITTGACLKIVGKFVRSLGSGQDVEIHAGENSIFVLGKSGSDYPIQPKKHSLEFLREKAHLRMRTNLFSAVFRIRHSLAFAIHEFFNNKGFIYLHTPIITSSDAEGAGETFRVTTLDLEEPPFKSEQIEKIGELYWIMLNDHIAQKQLSSSVEAINITLKKIKRDVKEKDKDFAIADFESLVKAWPFEIANYEKVVKKVSRRLRLDLSKEVQDLKTYLVETGFFEKQIIKEKEYERLPQKISEKVNLIREEKLSSTRISVNQYHNTKKRYSLSFLNYKSCYTALRSSTDGAISIKDDFFGKSTNLTVSGQLEGELGAMAFSDVYTFGPTFRAENSNTARHLAEFWMIEPEVAFADIEDNQNLAEEFIQYIIRYAMEHNADDLKFLDDRLKEEEKSLPQDKRQEFGLLEKLGFVVNSKFERITYTEAIEILLASPAYKKKKFQYDVKWGIDLQSEHERYLVEKHFKKPVIVTGYPAAIKAFYMRLNDGCEEGKQTVAAMDILAPGIGEIVGGSQREERYEKLVARMEDMHIPVEEMGWYLDTRRFGACPHAGFGLGFERMVQFVTGMGNIRDVIPFARTPKNCEF